MPYGDIAFQQKRADLIDDTGAMTDQPLAHAVQTGVDAEKRPTFDERCLEAAFRFLLDREPKESILGRFDVTVISRYFPEFERELPHYLSRS